MSVKHVKQYYEQVTADYAELKSDLADMEAALADHAISPEQLEQMKQIIAPVKQNFETLSYFMYLLNQPNKKERQASYEKRAADLVAKAGKRTQKDIEAEDKKALQDLAAFKEDIQE